MPWYEGSSLLHHLEEVHIAVRPQPHRRPLPGAVRHPARRPDERRPPRLPRLRRHRRRRRVQARRRGRRAAVRASRRRSPSIDTYDGPGRGGVPADVGHDQRSPTTSTSSRGDMICPPHNQPARRPGHRRHGVLDDRADRRCAPGAKYTLKHTTRSVRALVQGPQYRLDVNTLHRDEDAAELGAQRDRARHLRTHGAAVLRRVPPQPRHRQLHPDRRGHQQHRRRPG